MVNTVLGTGASAEKQCQRHRRPLRLFFLILGRQSAQCKTKSGWRKAIPSRERSRRKKEKKSNKNKDNYPSSPGQGYSSDQDAISDLKSSSSTGELDDSKAQWAKAEKMEISVHHYAINLEAFRGGKRFYEVKRCSLRARQ